jgi:hypothetical protein
LSIPAENRDPSEHALLSMLDEPLQEMNIRAHDDQQPEVDEVDGLFDEVPVLSKKKVKAKSVSASAKAVKAKSLGITTLAEEI